MLNATWGDPRLPERFWEKVYTEPTTGCWLWVGALSHSGYGLLTFQRRGYRAHRFAYQGLVGGVPDGLELDHLCRTRCCVNPEHLEPVTHAVNVRRGNTFQARNAAKTHCPEGHAYDGSYRRKNGSVMRTCSICATRNKRAYKARQRAKKRTHGITNFWVGKIQ